MLQKSQTNDMASTAEELTKQVSLASNLLAENQWRDAGEVGRTIYLIDGLIYALVTIQNLHFTRGDVLERAGLQYLMGS
jgi:hypothetical protein